MKLLQAIGFAILSVLSLGNAYNFIGTNYNTAYGIWVVISVVFATAAVVRLLIKK